MLTRASLPAFSHAPATANCCRSASTRGGANPGSGDRSARRAACAYDKPTLARMPLLDGADRALGSREVVIGYHDMFEEFPPYGDPRKSIADTTSPHQHNPHLKNFMVHMLTWASYPLHNLAITRDFATCLGSTGKGAAVRCARALGGTSQSGDQGVRADRWAAGRIGRRLRDRRRRCWPLACR